MPSSLRQVTILMFVDFWNFQLAWNYAHPFDKLKGGIPTRIDWKALPSVLMNEMSATLSDITDSLRFEGINVYASVHPSHRGKDVGLKHFFRNSLKKITGYKVHVVNRRVRSAVDGSGNNIIKTIEKGVDIRIATDLFTSAIDGDFDVALLVSKDSDFCPAVQTIQARLGKQTVHVGFRRGGKQIRSTCWRHIILDGPVAGAMRSSDPIGTAPLDALYNISMVD
jgi:uncharacterized LabA/DUF88 family protein